MPIGEDGCVIMVLPSQIVPMRNLELFVPMLIKLGFLVVVDITDHGGLARLVILIQHKDGIFMAQVL